MKDEAKSNYTAVLRSLMQRAEISSFRALSQAANVSEWQVEQLRRGKAAEMRVDRLHRLSQALRVSLVELVSQFSELQDVEPERKQKTVKQKDQATEEGNVDETALKQEYQRLQTELQQQRQSLKQEFQQASLQILESWLLQFPTAAHAAQQNPEVPAVRLLPLMRPVEQLIKEWGIESIAPVGAELPYDPQQHQLMEGTAQAGDRVRVRYTGYRQGEKLLYRAKVSPIPTPPH